MKDDLTKEGFWAEAWQRHIDTYLGAAPRTGYWIDAHFDRNLSVLELAGGSCRDSRYLATRRKGVIGTDFDEKTIAYLSAKFPQSPLDLRREDAFALHLADKSIDLSFSNGFWVLFSDDDLIIKLAREQARVTRKWMVVIVHNGANARLRRKFARLASKDPLYDIRFFLPREIEGLIKSSGISFRKITFKKFGGPADILYRERFGSVKNPFSGIAPRIVNRMYGIQSEAYAERIACIVELH